MKRWWVKALIGFGVLVLLLGLSFLGSSVRSKNAVERYRDQLRAAGEKVDLKDVIPAPPPGQMNATPLFREASRFFKSALTDALSTNAPSAMKMIAPGKAIIGWQQPYVVDAPSSNSWDEIADALGVRAKGIELLHQFPDEGRLDFELDYSAFAKLRHPSLGAIKMSAQLLSWNAVFQLHAGAPAAAVTNLHKLLRIVKAYDNERLLISELFRIAMCSKAQAAQWELLQATNVTELQWIELQEDWTMIEFVSSMENAFLMERATAGPTFEYLRNEANFSARYGFAAGSSTPSSGSWLDDFKELVDSTKNRTGEALWRDSWSFKDEVRYLQGTQIIIETFRQIRTNRAFQPMLSNAHRKLEPLALDGKMETWLRESLNAADYMSLGWADRAMDKTLTAEAGKQLVIAAIAVKRFQLRHQRLPENLEALLPDFVSAVPHDPVDGLPLRFRRNPDGTFLLYSIGADGKDDGGNPLPVSASGTLNWTRGRDWVWPQAATAGEIEAYELSRTPLPFP
ncbi:MAG: hypothetical protein H7Y43_11985 [Akkermansiaceae bacterium]|nr:hypothetical protein [Verrucomicrobiales bacterium]